MKLSKICLSKYILDKLISKSHSLTSRKVMGFTIMVIGVTLVKFANHYDYVLIHIGADIIGYALHGLGCIPFFESLNS
jgi:hypothetical protein